MAFACSDLGASILVQICDKAAAEPLQLVGYTVASLIVIAIAPVRNWLLAQARTLFTFLGSGWIASRRLAAARASVSEDGIGPWIAATSKPPLEYRLRMESALATVPVIVSANLKGGVGKTTITANIAASFARKKWAQQRKPVLAIDLDYQGSLSSMLFAGSSWRPAGGELSQASKSIAGHHREDWLVVNSRPATWVENPESEHPTIRQVQGLEGLAAFYDLAETEDRLRLLWAIADEKRDIRYFLYELLHSDELRNKFSMVFIDAPPRLTTGCVQALVASTHLLIPTILDDLSADAVAYFGRQLLRYEKLWPHLQVLGIIGSMVETNQVHQRPALKTAGDRLRSSLANCTGRLNAVERAGNTFEFPYELCVSEWASVGRTAGKGIAYAALNGAEGNRVRTRFDQITDEIVRRMV
jgi:chromosome partitioning protein